VIRVLLTVLSLLLVRQLFSIILAVRTVGCVEKVVIPLVDQLVAAIQQLPLAASGAVPPTVPLPPGSGDKALEFLMCVLFGK
jgi:hypothetical protein